MSTQADTPSATKDDKQEQRQSGGEPQPGTAGVGADPHGKMPSAAEAEGRLNHPHREEDEEWAELDEALDDSFPASDPPSQTAKVSSK